ncbi:cytochrome P450-24 [Coleophoma crateriformis]|uniref:Cytochrome P450-24 n=1 Tax=Coleophoma crateriformis TaxID=565419 RepID=A0A3D8RJV5_9HELO|nr:cytochrome P450-24 [Coleophoma crateriformis]
MTNDADLLRKIGMARSTYARSEWNEALRLDPRINNSISETDEKKHAEYRRKVFNAYSGKDTPGREKTVDGHILSLVHLMETKYLSSMREFKVLDLAGICSFFTLDVITELAFGSAFGFLAADADLYDYNKSITPIMPLMELNSNITWIAAILNNPRVKKLTSPAANDGSPMGRMIGAAQGSVAKRYASGADDVQDMLGSFMRHGLTQLEAEGESLVQVMAGADSTSTAIRMTMYFIMTNPIVYLKLRAEIDAAEKNNQLSSPIISDAEAIQLPYLQAVVKEGLRIWPPGVGIATKWVPPEGDTLEDGRVIPGGTRIGWSAWGTQHNREVYGDDARVFRPERWLELEPGSDQLLKMERTHELIFGNGRYGCLGKNLATMELNKVIPTFMRRFEMTLTDPTTPFKSQGNGFFHQSGILVKITKRE